LIYELIQNREPFSRLTNKQSFIETVCQKHGRPSVNATDVPTPLKNLLRACWDKEPSKRPKFSSIVTQLCDIFISLVIDDDLGVSFWQKHCAPAIRVDWPSFARDFFNFCKVVQPPQLVEGRDELEPNLLHRTESVYYQCLHALMKGLVHGNATHDKVLLDTESTMSKATASSSSATNAPSPNRRGNKQPASSSNTLLIHIGDFSDMLEWFGPFRKDQSLLENVEGLLKKDWFHGNLSGQEAEDKIQGHRPGTYLFRFSASDPGSYAITGLSRTGSMKHYRIRHKASLGYLIGKVECKTLDEVVFRFKKELALKQPCPNSPFAPIFALPKPKTFNNTRYSEWVPLDDSIDSDSDDFGF